MANTGKQLNNNLLFSYLMSHIRYLFMHKFCREVSEFLSDKKSLFDGMSFQEEKDIINICLHRMNREVLLVLHTLDEDVESHKEKISKFSSSANVKVIHLWEDLWKFHYEKIESKLVSLFGQTFRIHGRETMVKSINNAQLLSFLSTNHLNVPLKAKFKYGLYKENELVAVMSFSNRRIFNRDGIEFHSFELLRFCNKLNHTVVGGFSKLLNHFIIKVLPDDIMTYVDKDWSDGQVYEQAGFALEGRLTPMMFYLDLISGKRIYTSEEASLLNTEAVKVFNSGSLKYIKYLKKT